MPGTTGWIVKLNAQGDIQWQKCYGGQLSDDLRVISESPDGSYWAVGYTSSTDGDVSGNHGGVDGWVLRLGPSGELMGQRCIGGSGYDQLTGLHVLPDGNALVSGYTSSTDGDITDPLGGNDAWTLLLDPNLEILWQRTLGGSGNDNGYATDAGQVGGAVITGHSRSTDGDLTGNNGESDLWVVKLAPWEVGMDELDWHPNMNLYPSPTEDLVQVEWNGPHAGPLSWEIIDLTGRAVARGRSVGGRWSVPVAQLAPGTYLMRVHGPKGVSGGRFVKE